MKPLTEREEQMYFRILELEEQNKEIQDQSTSLASLLASGEQLRDQYKLMYILATGERDILKQRVDELELKLSGKQNANHSNTN